MAIDTIREFEPQRLADLLGKRIVYLGWYEGVYYKQAFAPQRPTP